MFRFLSFPAAVVALLAAQVSFAAPITVSGALTSTDPTFNRPSSTTTLSSFGTNVHYDVIAFEVSASGLYTITNTTSTLSDGDSNGGLYSFPFNPGSPLTNLLFYNDDSGPDFLFAFNNVNLTQGTQYQLVVTTFENGITGAYSIDFSGVGDVRLIGTSTVPEPSTLAMLPLALLAFAATRRRSSRML